MPVSDKNCEFEWLWIKHLGLLGYFPGSYSAAPCLGLEKEKKITSVLQVQDMATGSTSYLVDSITQAPKILAQVKAVFRTSSAGGAIIDRIFITFERLKQISTENQLVNSIGTPALRLFNQLPSI